MRAEIIQVEYGYTATFERKFEQSTEQIWAMLTDNEKLQLWFPELRVEKLEEEGFLSFHMGDGTFDNMAITDFQEGKVVAFEWAEDEVRFELQEENGGTKLRLIEFISRLTPRTARDLAGWHMCLDVIHALLDDKAIEREQEWERQYPEYKRLIDSMGVEFD
ncbi:SRPBCC domain-containing protein [Planomicrobium sp. CPCC 101110]|uniref:SRPBCC domain-containing protein n=1 Tax=Planomicrobium sp. CPCC 101110 TaxID=2599619 RepID=UPI0011B65931|nr:SRPBCC domain-containing protein [Planomicrobium sp. CPCC 101110]TWT27885.1 activator of Hsp90 ATPase 1 family protein [Planomicrobium sp. CPCC 101110]